MSKSIWIRRKINRVLNSIAFIPTLVILLFLILSVSMIYFDYSQAGRDLKSTADWIRLKDPSTARTVVSVIVAGIISITVFSFSLVMVVLNQAASQLSNRILDKLVGNPFHQFLIGFYIGVIIFGLLLLTSIRDIESGVYVPALSTYLLILLSVISLLLFVFFLNSITQSIKYNTIIQVILHQTFVSMKELCYLKEEPDLLETPVGKSISTNKAGIFETFDGKQISRLAKESDSILTFRYPQGHFVLKDIPIIDVFCINGIVSKEFEANILSHISIVDEASVGTFFYSGFKQLSEIALKALSPGINDPGTATESLQALFVLLAYRLKNFPDNQIKDSEGVLRVITKEMSFDEIFQRYIVPVWDYGKKDRTINDKMGDLLLQLKHIGESEAAEDLLRKIQSNQYFKN